MKSFLIKVFWFSLPIVISLGPVFALLKFTGENYTSIDTLIKGDDKYLIGYAYSHENYRYLKWKTLIEKERKDVWALGSSRVLQFRKEMFERSFYNTGFTIVSINDFLPFVQGIPSDKYPEVLIMCLDHWMFNENWNNLKRTEPSSFWENSFSFSASGAIYQLVLSDLAKKKYGLSVFREGLNSSDGLRKVGLHAIVNNEGFRRDGSMYYGSQIESLQASDTRDFSGSFYRIKNGGSKFEYADAVNAEAFVKLEEFLQFCTENDIYVVGFMPPFADAVNKKMAETGKYGYLKGIYPGASECFAKHEFELWDLSNLGEYGSNDFEVIDGFHGGELTYLKMLMHMVQNGSRLGEATDLEKLKRDASNRVNDYVVYDY